MSYVTYTTDALVCGTWERRTADCSYLLFTREAGMLYAEARSVREERSRQRYALQDFSLLRVSLIKGKHSWKIGSVEGQKNHYHEALSKEARGSVVGLFRLLRRLVKGEEAAPDLFDYTNNALAVLAGEITERHFVQLVVYSKLLTMLGYVDPQQIPETLRDITPGASAAQKNQRDQLLLEQLYTQAITVSHL